MEGPENWPRRVLFVLQSTAEGGMETHAADLAAEYHRRGIAVEAIVPGAAELDAVAGRFQDAEIPVQRLNTDARAGRVRQMRHLRDALAHMRRFRPDVVHLQTGGATGGAAAVLLGRIAGARVVVTEHDVPAERPGFRQRLTRRVLNRACHAVIAVSRRNGLLRLERLGGPSSRMAAILNGVPVPQVDEAQRCANRAAVREEMGIDQGDIVIGSVVRLAEGKGLLDLVDAFGGMPTASRRLLLIGDGPLRMELESRAEQLGIGGRMRLAGHQPDPGRYVDAMDLFVLPVPAGSMSIALLEAMARGAPPLITFCGPEEAVVPGLSGYCAPPSDPAGLATAIDAALGDAAGLRATGDRAAAHVRRHFSVERVADDTLAVYRSERGRIPARLAVHGPPDPFPAGK